jgi:hypothetical protein
MDEIEILIEATYNEFRTNLYTSPYLRDVIRDWLLLLQENTISQQLCTLILMNMINSLHEQVEILTDQIQGVHDN